MKKYLLSIFDKILANAPISFRVKLFRRVSQSIGVRSFSCNGSYGVVDGSFEDKIVFPFYLYNGIWAPAFQKIVLDYLFNNRTGTFIDIGANIGLTSLPVAKRGVNCYCFEPEINNYASLVKNVIVNELVDVVKTFNFALYSEDTNLSLEVCSVNKGDHRIRIKNENAQLNLYNESSRNTISIKALKLDTVLDTSEIKRPLVVKMDTQGAEVRVLRGAEKNLKNVDYLFIEYWPYGLERMGDSAEAFMDIIKEFNFGFSYEDTGEIPTLLPISELLRKMRKLPKDKYDTTHMDIFLCRNKDDFQCIKQKSF